MRHERVEQHLGLASATARGRAVLDIVEVTQHVLPLRRVIAQSLAELRWEKIGQSLRDMFTRSPKDAFTRLDPAKLENAGADRCDDRFALARIRKASPRTPDRFDLRPLR